MGRFILGVFSGLLLVGCGSECGSCVKKSTGTVLTSQSTSETATSAKSETCPPCATPTSRLALLTDKTANPSVELKTAKLDDLLQDLKGRSGKLVVVDVWADYCLPCKREFPHLIDLSQKFAPKNVACISVCVDSIKAQESALNFLKKQNALITNYLLEEKSDRWQEHWKIIAIPAVFIYRDGEVLARFTYDDPDKQFTYEDVEAELVRLQNSTALKSGPQVGEEVPGPFLPLNVTGPAAGLKKCLYCANAGNPVAVVFARKSNPTIARLLKKLDEATIAQKVGSYAVFCSDDKDLAPQLAAMAQNEKLQQLILSIESSKEPASYEIADDAEVTVLLYNSQSIVQANHAFRAGELNDAAIDRIVADLPKIK